MTVEIENEYEGFDGFQSSLKQPAAAIIRKAVTAVLDEEENPYECAVNVLLTDDESIRAINLEQRGIDNSTDVLSFPMIDFEKPSCYDGFDDRYDLFDPDSGELLLGDIVISLDHVMAQADEYGHARDRELAFLVVHSMLHLHGYDHMEEEDRVLMEAKQKRILETAGFPR